MVSDQVPSSWQPGNRTSLGLLVTFPGGKLYERRLFPGLEALIIFLVSIDGGIGALSPADVNCLAGRRIHELAGQVVGHRVAIVPFGGLAAAAREAYQEPPRQD
jgi:hypothetical protein